MSSHSEMLPVELIPFIKKHGGGGGGGGGVDILRASDVAVPVSAWALDPETLSTNFPYRASVPLTGATANMYAEVVFTMDDAASGNYASATKCGSDCVYIYCSEMPDSAITVLSVIAL